MAPPSRLPGKLILQIGEVRPYNFDAPPGGYALQWRDAEVSDLPIGALPQ